MFKSIGLILTTVLTGITLIGVLIAYLAFSAGPSAPRMIETGSVGQMTTTAWTPGGGISVSASTFSDAITTLGYAHGRSRSWQIALWRQAALGRLSEWFGDDAVQLDRWVHQLGLAKDARLAVETLNPGSLELLEKYAEGLTLALTSNDLNRGVPFLLLDIQSEPWLPWHSIAVERLFAWIATEAFSVVDRSEAAIADRALRSLLHVYGFGLNTVTGVRTDALDFVAVRYVTGDSGIPFFVETDLDYASGTFTGLTVPGTLIAPFGRTHADTWALLLEGTGKMGMEHIPADQIVLEYERLSLRTHEELVGILRFPGGVLLSGPDKRAAKATIPTLRWSGFDTLTDTEIWLSALAGEAPSPELIAPVGLQKTQFSWTVTGSPVASERYGNQIVFISSSGEELTPQRTVSTLIDLVSVEDLLESDFSQSAREAVPLLLGRLPDSLITMADEREAVRYLRNWNHQYGAAEPGASILEVLTREILHQEPGTNFLSADSLLLEQLTATIQFLRSRFGPKLSGWRWDTVQQRQIHFPGSTPLPADGGRKEAAFVGKYLPAFISGPGHPQTFTWGSARMPERLAASSAWEGAIVTDSSPLYFRRPSVDFSAFLGTLLTADRPPILTRLLRSELQYSTSLVPAINAGLSTSTSPATDEE